MQKDKIKAPFSEECIDIAWYPLSSLCPRDFYRSQSDKHSDLRGHASVTVMAVATDFHRDSLITWHAVLRLFGNELKIQMNCVYSFVNFFVKLSFIIQIRKSQFRECTLNNIKLIFPTSCLAIFPSISHS